MSTPSFDSVVNPSSRIIPLKEFQEDRVSPNPSAVTRLLDAGADLFCSIYQVTPAAYLADTLIKNGIVRQEYLLIDDLCRPRGQVPPTPVAPITGGQCECVDYQVSGDAFVEGAFSSSFSVTRQGKISDVGISSDGTNIGFSFGSPACPGGRFAYIQGNADEIRAGRFEIRNWNVQRVDGLPDNCGNLPVRFPPALPSPSDLTRSVPFQITPTLNVPVTVTVKPTFQFSPTLNAPVLLFNAGGLNVKFDLGGFTISPSFGDSTVNNFPNTTSPDPNPVPVKQPVSPGGIPTDLTPVLTRLDEVEEIIERCCDRLSPFAEPTTDEYDIATLGTGVSGTYNLPSKTFRVTVRVLTSPPHRKEIFGNGNPNVLFCGWAWFDRGGGLSERMPIDAEQKSYEPPARSQGTFVFSMYTGYTAEVKAYFAKSTATP